MMEKEYEAFLWGHLVEHRGLYLIVWEDVCMPRNQGGLDLVSLQKWNEAFLYKIVMQTILNTDSLWVKVYQPNTTSMGLRIPALNLIIFP